MSDDRASQVDPSARDPSLARLFAAVIVVEALVLLGLYWFGRHFV